MPQLGFVHRTWDDFVKFDRLLTTHLLNFGLDFPLEADLAMLDSYLQRVMTHQRIIESTVLSDFLGICRKKTWVNGTSAGRAMAVQRGYPSKKNENSGKCHRFQ